MKQTRSGIDMSSVQEVIDAAVSAKHATLGNKQQYETPDWLASHCWACLPRQPTAVLDPQCGSGNLLSHAWAANRFGWDIDRRFADRENQNDKNKGIDRIAGNCVTLWSIMDDVFPDKRFSCQVANPPFGIRWKLPNGSTVDSTEHTWKNLMKRTAGGGYGFMIANSKTIERLKINDHEWVYLYQVIPAGVWKNCDVEVGIVHWFNGHHEDRVWVRHGSADPDKVASNMIVGNAVRPVKEYIRGRYFGDYELEVKTSDMDAIRDIHNQEESGRIPKWNIYMAGDRIKVYLSAREKVKRKVTRDEINRLARVNNAHPMTLTTDRESRELMRDLVDQGVYSMEPACKDAILDALDQAKSMACPIMPVTDFETVAYADEEETLKCHSSGGMAFVPGKSYQVKTEAYTFTQKYKRLKMHWSEELGMETVEHDCQLEGKDRCIKIMDEEGVMQKFMDQPTRASNHHDEKALWDIFVRPEVRSIAEEKPESYQHVSNVLRGCEMMSGFEYYEGQRDYISRVASKDYGLIAADVGVGKTLVAISLIQIKAPKRVLIVAPQGTIRSTNDEEEEDNDLTESSQERMSQWEAEIDRFAPGLEVHKLFSFDDYHDLLRRNGGELPDGVFITYFQSMFQNGGMETAPKSWNDEKLANKFPDFTVPEPPNDAEDIDDHWVKSIGKEVNGIRCIISPCLASVAGHWFDMLLLDEAHTCCHQSANLTQMLIRMQPRYRFCLTATPIPNIVSDMFSLMGWLCVPDWYKTNRRNPAWPYARDEMARFEETFLATERDLTQERMKRQETGRSVRCVKKSPVISSPARLLKILKPSMAYISKEACNSNLVKCDVMDIRVPMGTQQSALYNHFLNRGNIPCKNPLIRARKQVAYLRNICADPANFKHGGPVCSSNINPKTIAVMELIRDIMKRGEQVVFISSRLGQSGTIARLLEECGVEYSRIDSTIPPKRHSAEANQFKAKQTQVLIMGLKCAMAYSFPECPNMVIGSIEYSYGSLHQAKGRVWRVNSKQDVKIYCVLNQNSIEETMFDTCATKQDNATICLHGKRVPRDYRPVEIGEVLAKSILGYSSGSTIDEAKCKMRWPEIREEIAGQKVYENLACAHENEAEGVLEAV